MDYSTGVGLRVSFQNGPNFDLFSISVHHHLFDDELCSVRFQLTLTIVGIGIGLAVMRNYVPE